MTVERIMVNIGLDRQGIPVKRTAVNTRLDTSMPVETMTINVRLDNCMLRNSLDSSQPCNENMQIGQEDRETSKDSCKGDISIICIDIDAVYLLIFGDFSIKE